MASGAYNEGALQLQSGGSVAWASDTIEVVLVKSTYTYDPDLTAGTPAASEITGVSGYTGGFGGAGRKVLASKTLAKDNATNRVIYDAADPSTWTLGTGDTVGGAIIQKKGSASDATAIPLFFLDFADTPTNGGTFALVFDANGINYIQQ